jgi:hypothetical protein
MEHLPQEMILEVANYLSPTSLMKLASTSKSFAGILNDNVFWKKKLINDYGVNPTNKDKKMYFDIYKDIVLGYGDVYQIIFSYDFRDPSSHPLIPMGEVYPKLIQYNVKKFFMFHFIYYIDMFDTLYVTSKLKYPFEIYHKGMMEISSLDYYVDQNIFERKHRADGEPQKVFGNVRNIYNFHRRTYILLSTGKLFTITYDPETKRTILNHIDTNVKQINQNCYIKNDNTLYELSNQIIMVQTDIKIVTDNIGLTTNNTLIRIEDDEKIVKIKKFDDVIKDIKYISRGGIGILFENGRFVIYDTMNNKYFHERKNIDKIFVTSFYFLFILDKFGGLHYSKVDLDWNQINFALLLENVVNLNSVKYLSGQLYIYYTKLEKYD